MASVISSLSRVPAGREDLRRLRSGGVRGSIVNESDSSDEWLCDLSRADAPPFLQLFRYSLFQLPALAPFLSPSLIIGWCQAQKLAPLIIQLIIP